MTLEVVLQIVGMIRVISNFLQIEKFLSEKLRLYLPLPPIYVISYLTLPSVWRAML